jgi:mRNA interferase YafQ
MRTLVESTVFRKDVKRAHKRGHDLEKLDAIIKKLQRGEPLLPSHRAHPLKASEGILGLPYRTGLGADLQIDRG